MSDWRERHARSRACVARSWDCVAARVCARRVERAVRWVAREAFEERRDWSWEVECVTDGWAVAGLWVSARRRVGSDRIAARSCFLQMNRGLGQFLSSWERAPCATGKVRTIYPRVFGEASARLDQMGLGASAALRQLLLQRQGPADTLCTVLPLHLVVAVAVAMPAAVMREELRTKWSRA